MRYADFKEMETPRLLLRRIRMEDIQEYYERLFGDGDVCRYLLFDPHQDISESLESIEKTLARYEEGRCYRWGIAMKEDDSLIGVIELLRFDEEKNLCSFAYLLGCDYWNRGYATETLRAVFQFAFEELELERIVADHMAENPASGAVMRKAGMQHTGTEKAKYEKHGIFHDAEVYEIRSSRQPGLTAREFQKKAVAVLKQSLSQKDMLSDGIMGLCGGSGKAAEILKQHLRQGEELDRDGLAKALGDIALSLAQTAHGLDIPLEEILKASIDTATVLSKE